MSRDMTETVDKSVNIGALRRVFAQEDINFLLTNRVPRIALTRLVGRLARIESPLFAHAAIGLWRLFTDLDLSEAKRTQFASVRDCFTRELREGARPIDRRPEVLASPCDAIVGACGVVERGQVIQCKGMPYSMSELFGPTQDASAFEGGVFTTLRLTSAMYHRFHAPHDLVLEHATHIDGDTWNVNPIAVRRVERLFCRNERAVLRTRLTVGGHQIALVPVAAILVAGLRVHALDAKRGVRETSCHAALAKGQEMGWFEHGSTILVFAPPGFALAEGIGAGARICVGQALMRLMPSSPGHGAAAG
jgi:phosphatidylserine decarboxylase